MNVKITIPIDIPEIEILETEITADDKLLLRAESTQNTTECGICKREIACTFGHGQEIKLRHLPVFNLETYICLRPKRGQCRDCLHEPTTTQVVSWYEQRSPHTTAYDRHLLKQLVNSTIEDVSLKENIGYDAILGALDRQVEPKINWDEIDNLGTVGIDEIAMRKGRKQYSAIITSRPANGKVRVLAVLPDRKKTTVSAFLTQIPARLRPTIVYFTTDMWEGYLNAVEEFIADHQDVAATLVVDRFHVAQHYRDDFDTLRKQELKRLKQELSKEIYAQDCKGMLWPLRKNHAALDAAERQRLRRLFQHTPALHQAYTSREELTAIFNQAHSIANAERHISAWLRKVECSQLHVFGNFIKTLRNHWVHILNYFEDRITSGFVEGLNNKIKTIKRRCYGIRKASTLFQRLWLDLQGRDRFFLSTT